MQVTALHRTPDELPPSEALHQLSHGLVADLHTPRPWVFWVDLLASAIIGWFAFGVAVLARSRTLEFAGILVSAVALYRGVCFIHELTHLRRRSLPGFELAWNLVFGIPLLLPSFTYIGVHQDHHSLSTYGTKDDPEYLPFARSRAMIWIADCEAPSCVMTSGVADTTSDRPNSDGPVSAGVSLLWTVHAAPASRAAATATDDRRRKVRMGL